MKHYVLSIQQPDGGPPAPEVIEPILRAVDAFDREAKASGAWVFGGGLHDASAATVIRVRDDETLITDGPYVEGKEHVGGFTIVAATDLDEALEWGRKLSQATTLPVEVRSFQGDLDSHLA